MFLLPLQLPSAHQLLSNSLCNYQQILGGFVKTLLLFYLSFPTQVALALFQVISLDSMILIKVLSLWAIIFGLVQLLAFGRNLCWQIGLKIVLLCVGSSSQGLDPDPSSFSGILWSFHCDSLEGLMAWSKKIPCISQDELQRHFNLKRSPLGFWAAIGIFTQDVGSVIGQKGFGRALKPSFHPLFLLSNLWGLNCLTKDIAHSWKPGAF